MLTRLAAVAASAWYWWGLLLVGLALEGTALFYQYALAYGPCVLCIHVRLWVLGLILVALPGVALRRTWPGRLFALLATVAVTAGLAERAWQLLAVERGTVAGECSFDLGLPAWLALDKWVPWMFQVQEACGVTPSLPFGVTMAQALVPLAAVLLAVNFALLAATLSRPRQA